MKRSSALTATGPNPPLEILRGVNVLVVDDNRTNRRILQAMLQRWGMIATSVEGGEEPLLSENVRDTTNSYRLGVDYRGISKTTLSFDELLTYSKIDDSTTDNNLTYQLSNGTPVDLGMVFVGTSPCAVPVTNAATKPPTVTANCNGYLSYNQVQNPRSSFPTERFSFQSTYIHNLSSSG